MFRAALAASVALLVAVPAAGAQSGVVVAPEAGRMVTGAELGGGRVVWAQARDDLTTRLFAARVGTWRAALLASAAPPPQADGVTATVAATPSSALLATTHSKCSGCRTEPMPLSVQVFAGPWDALRPVTGDAREPYAHPTLSGDRLAFRVPASGGGLALRLLDPVSLARTDVPVVARPQPWAVAGDLFAAERSGGWVVGNWRTGEELYRPRFPAGVKYVWSVDLTPDGSALWRMVVDRSALGTEVEALTTPAAPAARELQRPGTVFAFANGRLLAQNPAPARDARITDLEERDVAPPARVTRAFDGDRIAWLERPCAVPLVAVWDVVAGDPEPVVPAPLCPGARSIRRPAVRDGAVRVRLRCDGDALTGCPVQLTVNVHRRRRAVRRAGTTLALSAGERRTVRLVPSRGGAPRGRVRITVVTEPSRRAAPGERRVARYRLRVR